MIRTITTRNSIWKFDLERKQYSRSSNSEVSTHPNIPYTDEWEPFEEIIESATYVTVIRPVPMGSGRIRQTGEIFSDELADH